MILSKENWACDPSRFVIVKFLISIVLFVNAYVTPCGRKLSVLGNFFSFHFQKVVRFGQTEIGCKDTKFPNTNKSFISKKNLKMRFL